MKVFSSLALVTAVLSGFASGAAYSITSVISETVGTTAVVTGSGDKSNTTGWEVGTVGRFLMSDGLGNTVGLQVEASNPTGPLVAGLGSDTLMVARTVNSQGLTDAGTLSIYVNADGTGRWSLDVQFSFFDSTFTIPMEPTLLLTSLDIDFGQRYYTSSTDFTSNNLYPSSTLTTPPAVSGYNGFTSTGDSVFSDPAHAVSSEGTSESFGVRLSHDGVALFMFEFRDPSQIVPEPSVALLGGVAGLALLRRRRRA